MWAHMEIQHMACKLRTLPVQFSRGRKKREAVSHDLQRFLTYVDPLYARIIVPSTLKPHIHHPPSRHPAKKATHPTLSDGRAATVLLKGSEHLRCPSNTSCHEQKDGSSGERPCGSSCLKDCCSYTQTLTTLVKNNVCLGPWKLEIVTSWWKQLFSIHPGE